MNRFLTYVRLLKIDVKTPETGVKTKEGVSLWLDSVVTVQVYSENSTVSDEEVRNAGYDDIRTYINSRQQSAISNFLGMDEAHINEKINDVLQGNLREIVSEMTVDQILTNRKQMAVSVVENARPDLAKMGLEVVTFNVQDVKDAVDAMGHNHGVIEAIGVEQEELVKKRASIAKAEAERDVSCAKAAAAMAANEKEIEAQTAIAQRNNELELAKSKLKAEADKAAADANAAGMIQTNLRAKEVMIILVIVIKKVVFARSGIVSFRNFWNPFAPSRDAHSYRSEGSDCMAAPYKNTEYPIFAQITTSMIAGSAQV